jgi:hypothetical protein
MGIDQFKYFPSLFFVESIEAWTCTSICHKLLLAFLKVYGQARLDQPESNTIG